MGKVFFEKNGRQVNYETLIHFDGDNNNPILIDNTPFTDKYSAILTVACIY